jgi:pimeloyl-ACP methyl ester carboxylesterase
MVVNRKRCRRIAVLLVSLWSSTVIGVEYRTVTGAGGVPLQVAEAGDPSSPGILLIHGATLSSSSWLQQLQSTLAEDFHRVAFDLRGHGNSGKPWDADSYRDSRIWADDVAAVIDATGLRRPVVVAWSYGGHVTMDFLRHYPADRIAGLVLVGSTGGMLPFPPPDAETAAEFARIGPLAMSPDAGDRLEAARSFVNGMVQAPVPQSTLDREIAAVLAVTPYVRQAMQGRDLDNSDLIGQLTMPVLFLMGDAERTTTPADVEKLMQSIPDSRLSVFPETGHMPFIERQERFERELDEFLGDIAERQ